MSRLPISQLERDWGPAALLILVLVLVLAVALCWTIDAGYQEQRCQTDFEFQQLVGGIGMGPAIDLSACAFAFDARLACTCRSMQEPLPGGQEFCPHHTAAVLALPLTGPPVPAPQDR